MTTLALRLSEFQKCVHNSQSFSKKNRPFLNPWLYWVLDVSPIYQLCGSTNQCTAKLINSKLGTTAYISRKESYFLGLSSYILTHRLLQCPQWYRHTYYSERECIGSNLVTWTILLFHISTCPSRFLFPFPALFSHTHAQMWKNVLFNLFNKTKVNLQTPHMNWFCGHDYHLSLKAL